MEVENILTNEIFRYETREYRILGYNAAYDYIYLFDVSTNTVKRLENSTQTMTNLFTVDNSAITRFFWNGNQLIWLYESPDEVTYGGCKR